MSKICECGVEIEFATSPKGAKLPLRPLTHMYRIENGQAIPVTGVYVSHFTDCPLRRNFGKNAQRESGSAETDRAGS